MADTITRRQGDRLPVIEAKAFTADGVVDLTTFVSITFRMVKGSTVVTGAASGDADGNLTYEPAAGDFAVAGTYDACFVATDASGKTETFPTGTNLKVIVIPAI